MDAQALKSVVLDVLRNIQEMSGRKWRSLGDEAKPIGGLDGFDSLSAVEATVMIEEKLGFSFDLDSLFVSNDGKRALTLKEISKRLAKLLEEKGGTDGQPR